MNSNTEGGLFRAVFGWAAVVNAEVLVVVFYLLLAPVTPTNLLIYVYPFVWINVAVWALLRVDAPSVSQRKRYVAGLFALCYLLVLGYLSGMYGAGVGGLATGLRIEVVSLPPGWSPAVLYSGVWIRFALLPFKLIGYLALTYLVYVTLLETTANAAAGLLGLFSCVSCVLPLIATTMSSIGGGGGALLAAATTQSYALSTVVYVVTVALLVWQPTTFFPLGFATKGA